LISFAAIDRAEPWLEEQGINRNVTFASYLGRPYSLAEDAAVLVGKGNDTDGNAVGFCVEVSDRMGFLGGILVHPVGLTIHHKQAAFYSRSTSTPILTIIMSAMRAANSADAKATDDTDYADSAPPMPEPLVDQAVVSSIQPQSTSDHRAKEIERLAALRRQMDEEAKRNRG